MKSLFFAAVLTLFACLPAPAQTRIDDSFSFQTNPAKGYSIYVPSSYDPNTPSPMMLGMHPFNTNRWNSVSWCDTLIVFAESNNLLLVCPDGGVNGSIVDPIDTAFTTALLDSMHNWYNVDQDRTYIMGFSFGGRATYTYGLSNPDVFSGFLPIGAAITQTNEVNLPLQINAQCKPVYIVHGGNDNPGNRYFPILGALTNIGAITNSILMPGVGHTIDFPNRNQILTDAYLWIDSVNANTPVPLADFTFSVTGNTVAFTDNSTNATTWAWTFGDGASSTATNPNYLYPAAGTYNACLSVTNGATCFDTWCDTVNITTVGIDPARSNEFSVYPNPANTSLTVDGDFGTNEAAKVTISDLNGRVVQQYSSAIAGSTLTLAVEKLVPGLYIGTVQTGNSIESFRFEVNHTR